MNVRVDWEPGGGEQQPRRPSRTPRPARTPGRAPQGSGGQSGGPQRPGNNKSRSTRLRLGIVGGLGFAAVLVAVLAAPSHKSGHAGSGASPVPSQSTGGSTSSDNTGGLQRGTATAAGLDGSRRVSGLPRGFAHTTDGAVEAATTLMANAFNINRMSVADRTAYLTDVYVTEPAGVEAGAATWLQNQGLNTQGQYIDPTTGQPSTTDQYISNCHPELGAYKVVNSAPDAVTVDVWQPCLYGPVPTGGGDTSNVKALWMAGAWNMVFKGGDWRVLSTGQQPFSTVPQPAGGAGGAVTVATSFADRARVLASYGSGWELYADASTSQPAELGATQ